MDEGIDRGSIHMDDPFEWLGLGPEATEAEVRRAYAARLRHTRPDDDPVGFQRLNEVYRIALQRCRLHGAEVRSVQAADGGRPSRTPAPAGHAPAQPGHDTPGAGGSTPVPTPPAAICSLPPPPPEPESPATTLELILEQADCYGIDLEHLFPIQAQILGEWLEMHEPLYLISHKQEVATLLASRFEGDHELSIPAPCLDVLCSFFDIRDVDRLQRIVQARWAIKHECTSAYGEPHPSLIRQLKRRPGPRSVLLASIPGLPGRAQRLGMRLQHALGHWPTALDAGQMSLLCRLARPDYWGRWRWATLAVQVGVAGLAVFALSSLATGHHRYGYLLPAATSLFIPASLFLAWHVFAWLQHLVRIGQSQGRSWLAQLPAELAAAALLLEPVAGAGNPVSIALAVVGCLLVWRRAFIASCFGASAYMLHSHYAGGPLLSSLVAGAAAAPIALLALDILSARARCIPVAAAASLPSPAALVVACAALVFSFAVVDLDAHAPIVAIAVMAGLARLALPGLRAL